MNKWIIGIKARGAELFDLSDLAIIEAPRGRYWADPFLAGDHLFFEQYDYVKGVLGVAEIDGLRVKNPRIVLEEPRHLSFPSVFRDGADWYMTPERGQAGELLVYRATRFPDLWEPFASVARGRYDDPVVRKLGRGYEIWTTEENRLRIFDAPALGGPWRLVRSADEPAPCARSAGHFFEYRGRTCRPTQECIPVYGRALSFYAGDEKVHAIEPTWHPKLTGTHTFNCDASRVVIDGRLSLEPHG